MSDEEVRSARTILAAVLGGSLAAGLACNAITGVGALETADCLDCIDAAPERVFPPAACACAPVAPDGWRGPMALVESTGAVAPSCPGLLVGFEGGANPSGSAGCTPCTCGAPSATCGMTAEMFGETTCVASSKCGATTAAPAACARLTYCAPSGGANVTAAIVDGGCAPDGGALEPMTWERRAVACVAERFEDHGCEPGQTCSPGVVGSRTCILRTGDEPCPPGAYQSRIVYHASAKDERACSPCTCDPPSGVQCTGGAVTLYANATCSAGAQVVAPNGCKSITASGPLGGMRISTPPVASGGSCAPKGGEPLDGGAVTPSEPTTACCLP